MSNPNAQTTHLVPYQFKKGQSGNPSGGKKPLLTKADVESLFQHFARKTKDELLAIVADPNSQMIEIMIASVIMKTTTDGDATKLEFLLSRAVGKVKDEVVVDNDDDKPKVIVMLPANGSEIKK